MILLCSICSNEHTWQEVPFFRPSARFDTHQNSREREREGERERCSCNKVSPRAVLMASNLGQLPEYNPLQSHLQRGMIVLILDFAPHVLLGDHCSSLFNVRPNSRAVACMEIDADRPDCGSDHLMNFA